MRPCDTCISPPAFHGEFTDSDMSREQQIRRVENNKSFGAVGRLQLNHVCVSASQQEWAECQHMMIEVSNKRKINDFRSDSLEFLIESSRKTLPAFFFLALIGGRTACFISNQNILCVSVQTRKSPMTKKHSMF